MPVEYIQRTREIIRNKGFYYLIPTLFSVFRYRHSKYGCDRKNEKGGIAKRNHLYKAANLRNITVAA